MKFNTVTLADDLTKVTGLAVVIDVLRAFTSSCFILHNGAKCIYPVSDLDHAFKLKKENPDWILVAERKGFRVEGSDYGNSPTKLENVDLSNKTVILSTTAGTQAIDKLINAEKIITAAFVNAAAIVNYIQKNKFKKITFICTDNRWSDNEDYQLAKYIQKLLLGENPDFVKIKEYIGRHECAEGFLKKPYTPDSKTDFKLSFDLDRFDFVIEAQHDKDHVCLIKV